MKKCRLDYQSIFIFFKIDLSFITRFHPVVGIILNTFDMFSPNCDNPQRIAQVIHMFQRDCGVVTFSIFVANGTGSAAVVSGVKSNLV